MYQFDISQIVSILAIGSTSSSKSEKSVFPPVHDLISLVSSNDSSTVLEDKEYSMGRFLSLVNVLMGQVLFSLPLVMWNGINHTLGI